MSTFDGIVTEFPEIQIDYFRKSPERPPPLACFLSHVHSDHLQGLESFRAPFIYCSPATRELLLRIEKYPHRMNFHKGILESRRLHYKHLAKLLRPIPLNTPTEIELTPRRLIRVTLFDANHCPGAVMFLIEGDGKAILYTGDIRAERWWNNSLARHPILIPYTLGRKRLDKLYLDTTFARASNPLCGFPSKADGLAELLRKAEAYSDDTVFYFRAWTFGYEDVWLALSAALNAKVHVDRYQMGLYRSLANVAGNRGVSEAPALCGFELGNRTVAGCLSDSESSRIHSCELGVSCPGARGPKTVYITPIVSRTSSGAEIPEIGAGGGIGDLYQIHELELPDESTLAELEKLCLQHVHDKQRLSQMKTALVEAFRSRKKALSLDQYGVKEEGDISLEKLVTLLDQGLSEETKGDLPNMIRFPYSRHSSYSELCELVASFRPKDIHPCTEDPSTWSEDVSMRRLFGHLCSGSHFSHDVYMRETLEDMDDEEHQRARKRARYDVDLSTQSTDTSSAVEELPTALDKSDRPRTHNVVKQTREPEGKADESQHMSHNSSSHLSSLRSISPSADQRTISTTDQPPEVIHPTKAKRDEVQRAHHYLQEHADPDLVQINPLPSSWSNEDVNPIQKDPAEAPTIQPRTPIPSTTQTTLTQEHKRGHDIPSDEPSPPQPTYQQESQQTDILTISISESALAASPPPQNMNENEERNHQGPETGPENGEEGRPVRDRTLARTRARVAAYLAAREGSYSAWADVSLVSAGDNHAEEEMEL